jgi:hypothetical protein
MESQEKQLGNYIEVGEKSKHKRIFLGQFHKEVCNIVKISFTKTVFIKY